MPELDDSVVTRFEQQVAAFSDKTAVSSATHEWSYAELNRRANGLAHVLLSNSPVGSVGLLLEHDAPMIAAILGALKAGWIYVPLDPSFPRKRLQYMVADAKVSVIVTSAQNASTASAIAPPSARVLPIDHFDAAGKPDDPAVKIPPKHPAYVLYTSGSTGQPKGVLQTHSGILHHIRAWTRALDIGPEDRMTLLSSFSWDSSIQDMYGALLNGSTTYPIDVTTTGLDGLVDRLLNSRLTIYHAAVPLHRQVTRALRNRKLTPDALRLVALGADLIYENDIAQFRKIFAPGTVLINAYGATESTTGLIYKLSWGEPAAAYPIPIGTPVDETRIALVDEDGQPVPDGEVGEITIASAATAVRYLNRPDESSAKFATDLANPDIRIYKTGDLSRRLPDGNFMLLGRKDSLLKIRGMRVEPSEIERLLRAAPGVEDAIVAAREITPGDKRLVGYVVPVEGETVSIGTIRSNLANGLPTFMVPSAFVVLDALPLTATRKVDRQRLPEPVWSTASEAGYVAPSSPAQAAIAKMWANHLKIPRVGVEDNFFELGGDSLMALEIAMEMSQSGLGLLPQMMFEHPTIAELADIVGAGDNASSNAIEKAALARPTYPASAAQWGIYFECLMAGASSRPYVEQSRFLLGNVDQGAFERAWQIIVDREPILRTGFRRKRGGLEQHPQSNLSVMIEKHDWRRMTPVDQAKRLALFADEQIALGFRLSEPPLFRLAQIETDSNEYQLFWTYHHILIDGWSEALLLSDLVEAYQQLTENRQAQWPTRPLFRSYVDWLEGQDLTASEAYWRAEFGAGRPPTKPRSIRIVGNEGAFVGVDVTRRALPIVALKESAQRCRVTQSVLLQALWALALSIEYGTDEVIIPTIVSGRDTGFPNASKVVGLLANVIPVRIAIEPARDIADWVVEIQRNIALARRHSKVPLSRILELAGSQRDRGRFLDNVFVYFDPAALAVNSGQKQQLRMDRLETITAMPYPTALVIDPSSAPQAHLIRRCDGAEAPSPRHLLDLFTKLAETVTAVRDATSVADLMARL